jgi:hypothetical protein
MSESNADIENGIQLALASISSTKKAESDSHGSPSNTDRSRASEPPAITIRIRDFGHETWSLNFISVMNPGS